MTEDQIYAIIGFTISASFYFLPAIIAMIRNHHNKAAITVTNLLLGWTGIIWIVALIWSLTNPGQSTVVVNNGRWR